MIKMSLAQLPASTVKLITSSQIITSVSSAVKELLENALDAGASSVDVKLVNYGLDRLEVKDNGSGISKENTQCMALPHYTSKISDFSDLESLVTYGFRGEALNALCNVGQVSITTATPSDPMAMVYTLDSSGNISGSKPSPPVRGTTVVVLNLFKNLPVRRQYLGTSRKAQEELKQVEMVVKSLAVIKPSIRVSLFHNKHMIWQKTPCSSLQNSFSQLVGYSCFQHLEHLCWQSGEVAVEMLVPKRDCDISVIAKSTPSFSFVFVNTRPVTYKKVLKILRNELTKKFEDSFPSRKFPVCLISIKSSPSDLDVNLEPNKTRVLLKNEDELLSGMEKRLNEYYSISNLIQEISAVPLEVAKAKEYLQHSPPQALDAESTTKRRKLDDQCSDLDCRMTPEISCISKEVPSKTPCLTENTNKIFCAPRKDENVESIISSYSRNFNMSIIDSNNESVIIEDNHSPLQPKSSGHVHSESTESEDFISIQSNKLLDSLPQTNGLDENACDSSHAEKECVPDKQDVEKQPSKPDLQELWDDVNDKELIDLNGVLDDLESGPITSTQNGMKPPSADLIGSEAWSMGHVGFGNEELVKGSCVLAGRQSPLIFGRLEKPNSNIQQSNSPKWDTINEPPKKSPNKSPKPVTAPKSSRGYEISPGMDSSVSSQMGRKELSAFTKFAREIRPQIILENPGISFTSVASILAQKWQGLSTEEREHYEELARATATTKKVWKTAESHKSKLDWVKKLPDKNGIKKTFPSQSRVNKNRPHRKVVSSKIDMNDIKMKLRNATLSIRWQEDSNICLIGQLEPSGTWICKQNTEILVLNHSRLQEVVINHRLLCTHALLTNPLNPWQQLDQIILGEEAWNTLLSLPYIKDPLRGTKVISADFIFKNGFKIEIRDDQTAFLTEVSQALNYYGVKELKETFELSKNLQSSELPECRPLRVVNHIKSEAMRICRKSTTMLGQTMMQELLDYWTSHPTLGDKCLHSKPILTPLYDLAQQTQLFP
ncbi:PMS1 protein-like protein 1 [Frankliniella fusca]|uniref:PMS1 protein-like protein 1 n=1 Tax=Frankliniella fusca TaxID=407009 RepID=A0AAE1LJG2_9NEOP|nr:PMS1 protein-like protein 1 [Frankliniella fusca]